MRLSFFIIYMALFSLIVGCASNSPAPVIEKKIPADKSITIQKNKPVARAKRDPSQPCPDVYIVKPGDTLYSLSLIVVFITKKLHRQMILKNVMQLKWAKK